jgi:ionotropic kainate glutamate receptor 2
VTKCKLPTLLICTEYLSFQVELKGLSGPIEFKEGRRIQFKLDLLKLKQHSLVKVGEWSPNSGVNITDRSAFFDPGTMNVTLVVITIPVSSM